MLRAWEVLSLVGRYVKWYHKWTFVLRSQLYDAYYNPASNDELQSFLSYWSSEVLPQLAYSPDSFDCDDYAFLFKALMVRYTNKNCCFFVVGQVYKDGSYLGLHAFNAVLVGRGVAFVEPMTGEVLSSNRLIASSDGFCYDVLWIVG